MEGLSGPLRLLDGTICYALESVEAIEAEYGSLPTPCQEWDLHALLAHLNDSIAALQEGFEVGVVPTRKPDSDGDPTMLLVMAFRARAEQLRNSCTAAARGDRPISIGGVSLAPSLAIVVGAVELAVHGWDVSVACGRDHPIPARLALGLLSLSQLIIDHSMRRSLFDGPVPVSPLASPSDQLVAFLGRGTVRQP